MDKNNILRKQITNMCVQHNNNNFITNIQILIFYKTDKRT